MKKYLAAVLTLVMMFAACAAFAQGTTFEVEEVGQTITLPEGWWEDEPKPQARENGMCAVMISADRSMGLCVFETKGNGPVNLELYEKQALQNYPDTETITANGMNIVLLPDPNGEMVTASVFTDLGVTNYAFTALSGTADVELVKNAMMTVMPVGGIPAAPAEEAPAEQPAPQTEKKKETGSWFKPAE